MSRPPLSTGASSPAGLRRTHQQKRRDLISGAVDRDDPEIISSFQVLRSILVGCNRARSRKLRGKWRWRRWGGRTWQARCYCSTSSSTSSCWGSPAGHWTASSTATRLRGNDATLHFVQFAVLAAVVGVAAKLATAYHARAWRPQGLAAAASLGTVAWAATALAFGLACKEMRVVGGGERGWRLRALEGLTATLAFTQLLYVLLLHAAVAGDRCGLGCPADDDQPRGPCSLM
ncbi:uncharacterized protein LOC133903646 isoform X1 [Phragmites australis]|uniref:uncharacterized protein LOC133903646 isoform X1 n=1 Tax=Phragmites australis TaxID=29695 RepID=UPI002D792EB4|nr:uncharacterized protein LOC133903646 isoform X1 [Phragmites australis]